MHEDKELTLPFLKKNTSGNDILKLLLVIILRLRAISILNYLLNVYNHKVAIAR